MRASVRSLVVVFSIGLLAAIILVLFLFVQKAIPGSNAENNMKSLGVMYQYENSSPLLNKIVLSDINGINKQEMEVNSADWHFGVVDGKMLVRSNPHSIELAIFNRNPVFRNIFSITDQNTTINDFVWSADHSRIVALVVKDLDPNGDGMPFFDSEKSLYIINPADGGRRLATTFKYPPYVSLLGLNLEKHEVYFSEFGDGGVVGDYYIVSTDDGAVKKTIEDFRPYDSHTEYLPDFSRTYYIENGCQLLEYSFVDNIKTTLFSIDKEVERVDGQCFSSYLHHLVLSTQGERLVFTQHIGQGNPDITYIINLTEIDRFPHVLINEQKYANITPVSWSPDGRYLWLESYCPECIGERKNVNEGEYYILDLEKNKMLLFFKGKLNESLSDRSRRTIEKLQFGGWITQW